MWQALVPGLGKHVFHRASGNTETCSCPPVPMLGTTALPHLLPTCLLLTLGEAARRPHKTDQVCLSLGLDRCSRCVQIEAAAFRSAPYWGPSPRGRPYSHAMQLQQHPATGSKGVHLGWEGVSSVPCVSYQPPDHGQASSLGHRAQYRRAGTVKDGPSQPAAQHGARGRRSYGDRLDLVPCLPSTVPRASLVKATLVPVPRAPLWLLSQAGITRLKC